nr:sulfatase-like hydrolase/transferase [Conchiformibius kuhniae]
MRSATYRIVPAEYFARDHYFIANSQTALYHEHHGNNFLTAMRQLPELKPIAAHQDHASKQLLQPASDKILFIVAESWGVAREASVQRAVLQKIYDRQDKLEFIREGYFDFGGATVQGELRELCRLTTEGGYAFHKTDPAEFAGCLPNTLKQQGYRTIAMHGASSRLYDRHNWYTKAGFAQTLFVEDLADKPRCYAFNGTCDRHLYDQVANAFKQNPQGKTFFYWLTLTSHSPYAESDMHQPRLDCRQHQLFEGDICNNMRLNAQFFDGLAELTDRPEMRGVEVIVVGDHMPPIFTNAPIHKNLRWNDVSWLHFKIK